MRALKVAAIVLIIGLGSCVSYYSYWSYQWERAETDANRFCRAATVGSDIANAIALAKSMERRVIDSTREGQRYYVVFFPGPIFNQFVCELDVTDGKVTSSRVIKHDD